MAYFIPAPTAFPTTPDIASTYGVPMALVSGFEMIWVSDTIFTVKAGNANAENNGEVIEYPSVIPGLPSSITVDITKLAAVGETAGNLIQSSTSGVYPVSIASFDPDDVTTFPVYAVSDSSGKYGPIVVVATGNNFLPSPYDSFRRIGFVMISSEDGLIEFVQSGSFMEREYMFASVTVLNAGAETTSTLVDLSLNDGPVVPGPVSSVKLEASFTPDSQADIATLGISGTGLTPIALQASATTKTSFLVDIIPGVDPITGHAGIQYHVSTADDSLSLAVIGFTDNLRMAVV